MSIFFLRDSSLMNEAHHNTKTFNVFALENLLRSINLYKPKPGGLEGVAQAGRVESTFEIFTFGTTRASWTRCPPPPPPKGKTANMPSWHPSSKQHTFNREDIVHQKTKI